jgi:hypothetical protein
MEVVYGDDYLNTILNDEQHSKTPQRAINKAH